MTTTVTQAKKIVFEGHRLNVESGGCISQANTAAIGTLAALYRVYGPIYGVLNIVFNAALGKKEWKRSETVRFPHRVCSVELKVLVDDTLHDTAKLAYDINGNDVTVTATFSHSIGNPILEYDVVIEVNACILMEYE